MNPPAVSNVHVRRCSGCHDLTVRTERCGGIHCAGIPWDMPEVWPRLQSGRQRSDAPAVCNTGDARGGNELYCCTDTASLSMPGVRVDTSNEAFTRLTRVHNTPLRYNCAPCLPYPATLRCRLPAKRAYVEAVATCLEQSGITVFYDRHAQVSLWGKDLAAELGQIYSSARFVVLFASKHYAAKAWTTMSASMPRLRPSLLRRRESCPRALMTRLFRACLRRSATWTYERLGQTSWRA